MFKLRIENLILSYHLKIDFRVFSLKISSTFQPPLPGGGGFRKDFKDSTMKNLKNNFRVFDLKIPSFSQPLLPGVGGGEILEKILEFYKVEP